MDIKFRFLLVLFCIFLFACKKKKESTTYTIFSTNGYSAEGDVSFTENGTETLIHLHFQGIHANEIYSSHIHENDTSKYGNSIILFDFGEIKSTTDSYDHDTVWQKSFSDIKNINACVALHNTMTAVALGNIGSNAN